MHSVAQTVGANVRRLRRNRGLSLVELGQHASIAKGTLTQLEAGRGNPTLETIQALGRALGVAVSDLVTEPTDDAPLVVRADGGTRILGWSLDAQLIHRSHTTGAITELYRLEIESRTESPAHPYGVVEQLYVLSGTIAAGPLDAMATAGLHDFVQFQADRAHAYDAVDGPACALLWMTFPSFSLDTAPFQAVPPAPAPAPPAAPRAKPPQVPARGTRPATRAPSANGRRGRS
ncbi:MAG: helix-turn-helix domain-containing protein [Patulibacter sp.]|nr:helix-turn-helix domain-containing protein [Patulibacter sp.]